MNRFKLEKTNSWRDDKHVYVEINYSAIFRFQLKDEMEINFGMVQLYRAKLGSSREIGKIFGRSSADVIRKTGRAKIGIKNLIDGRMKNGSLFIFNIIFDFISLLSFSLPPFFILPSIKFRVFLR
jgi:hypothetical protein